MSRFDTIVIGAGPGGLRCATLLASHGQRVLVLERQATVGPKVCAGGIPHHALAEMGLPQELQEAEFPVQVIRTPCQRARVRFSSPVITTVSRERLGAWQLAQARAAGVEIRTACPVTAIGRDSVCCGREWLGFRYLVGADGSASLVRRHLGLPSHRLGVGINYQVDGSWPDMEWHLDPSLFRSGYAWIFPHRDSASIGAYAARTDLTAATLASRLQDWARQRGLSLADTRARAALINFDYQGWNFHPLFLVGDAAGLASGFTGEGIYPAMLSGETVARTIIDPGFSPCRLRQLLRRHRLHQGLQKFYTGTKLVCQISLEMLVLAIRLRLLGFQALEMY